MKKNIKMLVLKFDLDYDDERIAYEKIMRLPSHRRRWYIISKILEDDYDFGDEKYIEVISKLSTVIDKVLDKGVSFSEKVYTQKTDIKLADGGGRNVIHKDSVNVDIDVSGMVGGNGVGGDLSKTDDIKSLMKNMFDNNTI